jgi:hypothetical protein
MTSIIQELDLNDKQPEGKLYRDMTPEEKEELHALGDEINANVNEARTILRQAITKSRQQIQEYEFKRNKERR